jgi:hypothetical protein
MEVFKADMSTSGPTVLSIQTITNILILEPIWVDVLLFKVKQKSFSKMMYSVDALLSTEELYMALTLVHLLFAIANLLKMQFSEAKAKTFTLRDSMAHSQ